MGKKYRKFFLILIFVLLNMKGIYAQNQFKGIVVTIDGEPITGAQLVLSEGDQLVAISLASEEGKFSIDNIPSGTFLLEINALGYAEYVQTFTFDKDLLDLRFVLQPDSAMTLGELEVVGDRVRQTATGEVYFLSEKAKSSRNPFVALSEIPRLRVNVAIQSIKMEDDTSPIVLVDGKPVNTGVNPINSEDIASVEVIEVVSARYLQKGYQNMLNIKLKSKRRPYQFFQVAARSDILPGNGFGVGYFEVGNTKVSLFGRLSLNGTLNRNSDYEQWQEDTDFHKASKGTSLVNNRGVNGDLILKWQIGERDYMAAQFYGNKKKDWSEMSGAGTLRQAVETPFTLSSNSVDNSYILTGGLFYQHDFKDKSQLQARYWYNKNRNKLDGDHIEAYSRGVENKYLFEYDNQRSSMNLEVNYTKQSESGSSIDIGSNTRWINDKIEQVSEQLPIFNHRRFDEYFYASFSSKIGKLNYMLSAGLEGIWLDAGGEKNSYWRPRFAVSGNYVIDKKNTIRLNYNLTNTSPSVGQLNPYNTSSDPLVVTRGNHLLMPEQMHTVGLNYRLRLGRFFLTPLTVTYNHYTNRITPYSYIDQGVRVNTYQNDGKFDFLYWGANINYNFRDGLSYAYVGGGQNRYYFEGQEVKTMPLVNAGVWWYKGKWMFGADISWQKYSYTPQSRTQYFRPTFAQLQVNYNITPDFYIAVALQNFTGALTTETFSETGSFKSYNWNRQTDLGFRPWILLRYTIRKHTKEKIGIGNVLQSQEQGIKL
ncbi:hypothetical protein IX339_001869 [Porphyromonas levii]|nr:hypothetical protein [Porphyromonas levii]MBR8760580.1 hypothetical protein [Porphyromonas levii]MBR8766591.1 hypothetical protein [Porphyromonas levii]MBR8803614.1 hypothetical protein [Porphyromonas levii]